LFINLGYIAYVTSLLFIDKLLLKIEVNNMFRLVLPRDVCPSLCPSVGLTLVDCDQAGWNFSKIISQLVSLGVVRSLQITTSCIYSKGNTPKFWPE